MAECDGKLLLVLPQIRVKMVGKVTINIKIRLVSQCYDDCLNYSCYPFKPQK